MAALAGQRAVVVGPGRVHAAGLARALAAAGADVAELPDPEGFDGIDILVICPSRATEAPGGRLDDALREVEAAGRWTAEAARAMRQRRRGVIVHVTGLAGLGGWPGWESTGLGFAAIHNLVASTAVAVAPDGVRVNALVAGVTADLGAAIAAARGITLDAVRARIPDGRFIDAEALGNALLYLVHDSASYVTGETLTVDGGWDVWGRLHAAAPA
jgi:NAD(P)-dependent dehydrogenase (short-subunit alcohol dehydrogenase family)